MTRTATVRRIDVAQDLKDEELVSLGLMDEENMEFDRPVSPGEEIFAWSPDGHRDSRFSAAATGSDMTPVSVYTVEGERRVMPREWAIVRLKKRFGKDHPKYANQPVFYRRAPREFPEPAIDCPSQWSGGCGTKFHTELQVEMHMKNRHSAEWAQRETIRQRDQQERLIAAQEAQADLMRTLLAGGRSGTAEGIAGPGSPEDKGGSAGTKPAQTA